MGETIPWATRHRGNGEMEINIREFLSGFHSDELVNRGILIPDSSYAYLLRRQSVNPLIALMREKGVTRVVSNDQQWFLTSESEFHNPGSCRGDPKQGRIEDLRNPGNVFTAQNKNINPFFQAETSEC